MSRSRRLALFAGLAVLVCVVFALIAPPNLGNGSSVALRRFLSGMGVPVGDAVRPGDPRSTFYLAVDQRSEAQDDELLAWARSGGQLVIADPSSALFRRLSAPGDRIGIVGSATLPTDCALTATAGVASVQVSASDIRSRPRGSGARACFASGGAGYAVFVPEGRGSVVLLGGDSPLTDGYLRDADNATFAYGLLGTHGPVVFGAPVLPGASGGGLWHAVPTRGRALILELVVAALLFALARGRRFGRPIDEEPISPIPSGELVKATAGLYRRAKARAYSAEILRRAAGGRLARRLGLPETTTLPDVAVLASRATDLDADELQRTLNGPPPADDGALVALAEELDRLTADNEGANR